VQTARPDRQLDFLRLGLLKQNWDSHLKQATAKKISYSEFLTRIIDEEYASRTELARLSRVRRANVPEKLVMSTFPFERQPKLKRRLILEIYESRRYISTPEYLVFLGPTGCGKTGLATAFLLDAIDNGNRGFFISFQDMLRRLTEAVAIRADRRALRFFTSWDVLLIDEFGYAPIDKEIAGLFFEIIKARHQKHPTLITSQLGFAEWGGFIQDSHLCSAILNRVTENCCLFDMTKCLSLRSKRVTHAASA